MSAAPSQLESPQPAEDLIRFANEVAQLTTLSPPSEPTASWLRAAILVPGHEFDQVQYRRRESYAQAFERIFNEPLKPKRPRKGRDTSVHPSVDQSTT